MARGRDGVEMEVGREVEGRVGGRVGGWVGDGGR